MATLKMNFMIHVEDSMPWNLVRVRQFADLATKVGNASPPGGGTARGAKLSIQFDRPFLDGDAAAPAYNPAAPTSLSWVLEAGGNFWCHTHSGYGPHLRSVYSCVKSAYTNEAGAVSGGAPAGGPGGRSGGADEHGTDWVSVTQGEGLRLMNGGVMRLHMNVAQDDRPYGFSDEEILKLYAHDAAPGPIHIDVCTMRTRPFFVERSDEWFAMVNTTEPQASYMALGSVMMIPAPGRFHLGGMSERRSAYQSQDLTDADMQAALTEVWSTFQIATRYQRNVTNAWYIHIRPGDLSVAANTTIGAFVDSINALLNVHGSPQLAEWKNMNEIASLFWDDHP